MSSVETKTTITVNGRGYVAYLARIERADFGFEYHDCAACSIQLSWDGGGIVFGGHVLNDRPEPGDPIRRGTAAGMEYLLSILRTVGVELFSELKGKPVFVLFETGHLGDPCVGLAPPSYVDAPPFIVSEWQQKYFPKEVK